MKLTLYKARLKTSGKSPEQIKSEFEGGVGPEPSETEIQGWIKANDLIDGLEVVVTKNFLGDGFLLASWDKEDDEKIRDYVYQVEQDPFFGTYFNERNGFLKDWKEDEYEPTGSLNFDEKDVEIIGGLEKR